MNKTYRDLKEFYNEDTRRLHSVAAGYGVWWKDGDKNFPYYRVSYVQSTGEVYAVASNGRSVMILGTWPPDVGEIYYASLDKVLEGWAERCGPPGGIQWIRGKLVGTIMLVVCAWCGRHLGTKRGHGQVGTSHGMCRSCNDKWLSQMEQDLSEIPRETGGA